MCHLFTLLKPATHNGAFCEMLKGTYYAHFQVRIDFNIQKDLYCSHTACAAAPLFTLCLKPEPSLL